MLEFDVFCLKLRRWELHQTLEDNGEYIPAVIRENGKKLYKELTEGMGDQQRTSNVGMPARIASISIRRRGQRFP